MPRSAAEARLAIAELGRRRKARPGNVRSDLFGLQLAVINDPSRRKTVRCGRRSGKTVLLARLLYLRAHANPEAIAVYIALTRPTAERLMWSELKRMNERHRLGIKFNDQKLEAKLPNGGQIWLAGADDKREREKLRGHAFCCVCLDEAGSFGRYLEYLLDDVLDPALEDYDGELILAGTPPAACAGKFWEADTGQDGPQWSQHHWTVLQNPKFPRWGRILAANEDLETWEDAAAYWLEQKKRDKEWADDDPVYLREWLGRWIRDENSLVYKYDPDRNSYDTLPEGDWEYVLGVDLGYVDDTAFSVVAFDRDQLAAFVVFEHKEPGLDVTAIANKIKDIHRVYPILQTVVDQGALGKTIAAEMAARHNLPLEKAEKQNKFDYIELINADLRAGRLKMKRDGELAAEMTFLQYDPDSDRKKEQEGMANHLCDATLYAWRESRHYLSVAKKDLPEVGSDEYYRDQARRHEERLLERIEAEQSDDFLGKLVS